MIRGATATSLFKSAHPSYYCAKVPCADSAHFASGLNEDTLLCYPAVLDTINTNTYRLQTGMMTGGEHPELKEHEHEKR
jgi:hypothetical protein